MANMTKNKVQPLGLSDDLDLEEKAVVPEVVEEEESGTVSDEEEENEEGESLDPDEVDPFHDKWEE
jgi:hypothetical protein